jgi:hypothetical protein
MNFWDKKYSVFLLGVIALIINFIPQLFLNRGFLNWDAFLSFYPTFDFYKHQLASGGSIFWTSGILGGFPIYLDLSGGFFSPINFILFKILPVVTAYNLALLAGIALLFTSTYFFAKSLNISRFSSFLTAIAFSFGYQMTPWSNNLPVVNALFLFPFLLLVLNKLYERKYLWTLWGALGIGYALISGQPQWVLMSFVGAGSYILFIISASNKNKRLKPALTLLFCFLIVVAVGLLVASPQLLASQKLAAFSARSNGLSFNDAQINAQKPYDWVRFLFPEFHIKYVTASEPTLYVGLLPLIFALLAVWFFKKDKKVLFFLLLFLFGLLTAMRNSPIFWLIHKLPVFEYFRGSNRWMCLGNLGLAVLAGIGFDGLLAKKFNEEIWARLTRFFKKAIYILFAGFGVANLIYWLFSQKIINFLLYLFDKYHYAKTSGLPLEHYHQVLRTIIINDFKSMSLLNIKFVIPLVFFLVAYFVIREIKNQKQIISNSFAVIILVLSALNLLLLHPNYYQTVSANIVNKKPELVKIIESKEAGNRNKFRIFSVLPSSSRQRLVNEHEFEYTMADMAILRHDGLEVNSNMFYGLDSIDGFNNLMPRRNAEILGLIGSFRATTGDVLEEKSVSLTDKLAELSSRIQLISILNIKYLITPAEMPSVPGLNLVQVVRLTKFNIPYYLYENKKVMPRIYFADNALFLKEGDETEGFVRVTDLKANLSRNTFIECDSCRANKNYFSQNDRINILEYKDGLVRINAKTIKGRWLVFSESNLPGWEIQIDGKPVKQYCANYIFQGIYVPAGEHNIQFQYKGIQ